RIHRTIPQHSSCTVMKPTLATPPGLSSLVPNHAHRHNPFATVHDSLSSSQHWAGRRVPLPADLVAHVSMIAPSASHHYVYEKVNPAVAYDTIDPFSAQQRHSLDQRQRQHLPSPPRSSTACSSSYPTAAQLHQQQKRAEQDATRNSKAAPPAVPTITPCLTRFIATFIHDLWHKTTEAPSQTFVNYTAHVLRTTALPFSVPVVALLLVSRLRERHPNLRGGEGSECRLLVCALITAMKVLCDNTYTNATWAKVSGIPVEELNTMEMEFLVQLDFEIHVKDNEYFDWLMRIENAVAEFTTRSPVLSEPARSPGQCIVMPSPPMLTRQVMQQHQPSAQQQLLPQHHYAPHPMQQHQLPQHLHDQQQQRHYRQQRVPMLVPMSVPYQNAPYPYRSHHHLPPPAPHPYRLHSLVM
ncbi:hypothetical protein HKX48_009495, partial [Thoreauomyces humboldtii]